MAHYDLTVRPFDWTQPGSYELRKRWFKTVDRLNRARESNDQGELLIASVLLEELLEPQIDVSDGATLAEVLAEISGADFDALIIAAMGEVSKPPVPLASARRLVSGTKRASRSRSG